MWYLLRVDRMKLMKRKPFTCSVLPKSPVWWTIDLKENSTKRFWNSSLIFEWMKMVLLFPCLVSSRILSLGNTESNRGKLLYLLKISTICSSWTIKQKIQRSTWLGKNKSTRTKLLKSKWNWKVLYTRGISRRNTLLFMTLWQSAWWAQLGVWSKSTGPNSDWWHQ